MLKLKDVEEEVAIKKMMRRNVRIDSSLYVKINGQPNVINYYGIDDSTYDDAFTVLSKFYLILRAPLY